MLNSLFHDVDKNLRAKLLHLIKTWDWYKSCISKCLIVFNRLPWFVYCLFSICEWDTCNMRMVYLQYANGMLAICEWKVFLLREECFPFKEGIVSFCKRNFKDCSLAVTAYFDFRLLPYLVILNSQPLLGLTLNTLLYFCSVKIIERKRCQIIIRLLYPMVCV